MQLLEAESPRKSSIKNHLPEDDFEKPNEPQVRNQDNTGCEISAIQNDEYEMHHLDVDKSFQSEHNLA